MRTITITRLCGESSWNRARNVIPGDRDPGAPKVMRSFRRRRLFVTPPTVSELNVSRPWHRDDGWIDRMNCAGRGRELKYGYMGITRLVNDDVLAECVVANDHSGRAQKKLVIRHLYRHMKEELKRRITRLRYTHLARF